MEGTGDPETDEDLARMIRALHDFAWAGWPEARTLTIVGGNDYITIHVAGSSAAEFLDTTPSRPKPSN